MTEKNTETVRSKTILILSTLVASWTHSGLHAKESVNLVDQVVATVGERVLMLRDLEIHHGLRALVVDGRAPSEGAIRNDRRRFNRARKAFLDHCLVAHYLDATGIAVPGADDAAQAYRRTLSKTSTIQAETQAFLTRYELEEKELDLLLKDYARVETFLKEQLPVRFLVKDEEIQQYYDKHREDRFLSQPLDRVRSIVVESVRRERLEREMAQWLEKEKKRVEVVTLPIEIEEALPGDSSSKISD